MREFGLFRTVQYVSSSLEKSESDHNIRVNCVWVEVIEGLFYQFVNKLYEMGEVKYKNLFVDGTKMEAYANKYTFVWKSDVEKNISKLDLKRR